MSGLLAPVTTTVYKPGTIDRSTVTVRIADPEPVREDGLIVAVMPVAKVDAVREIGWLKPLKEVTVMVDVAVEPMFMVRRSGAGESVKSGPVTSTPTVAKWINGPLSAWTVTK